MNCANIRILLPEYIAGSLDASSLGQVASHLESCARCRETAESLNAVLSPGRLRGEPRGAPEAAYWAGLLPRIHERIQAGKQALMPAWSLRIALPAALAVVLTVVFLESMRVLAPGAAPDVTQTLRQMPQQELEEYVERQSIVGAEENVLTAQTAKALTTADREVVRNLLEESPETTSIVESYQDELLASVSDQDAEEIVSILERNK
jgi:anti-sigma factor RsiW